MNVVWKIALYGTEQQKLGQQKLHYAVQEANRESHLVPMDQLWNELMGKTDERACVYVQAPINLTLLTTRNRPNWIPGSWHDPELFRCKAYYGYWGSYIAQRDYAFFPLKEVYRKRDWIYETFGRDGMIFIRPDYGEKLFTGQLVAQEEFKRFWAHCDLEMNEPTTLCVVSRPIKIKKELRLLISNGKVAAGSTYAMDRHLIMEPLDEQADRQSIVTFVETVAADNPPPLPKAYLMDVAETDAGYRIMEIGCCAAAGYYSMHRVKVAKAISSAAEEDFREQLEMAK